MLRELHISNLAIIEKVDIELTSGLNVFTGATGAGKSLILGSLELLLGLRGGGEDDATLVRPGTAEARVSGLFEVRGEAMAQRLGEILDQPIGPAEPILITRRVSAAGRSSSTVNGSPVTAGMLREAGQFLVDIHGQHDQQFLLKPANQLHILDAYAGATASRQQFAETLRALRERQRRLAELSQSEAKRAEMLELYRFQIEEIDSAKLQPGEYTQAKGRYNVLKNLAHLKEQSAQVLEALSEGEDTILDRMSSLIRRVQELTRVDASLAGLAGQVVGAEGSLQDAGRALSRYQDSLDIDGNEMGAVEERLDLLNKLIHKYGKRVAPAEDPLAAVLAYRQEVGEKAKQLDGDSRALAGLEQEIVELARQVRAKGAALSRLRRHAAKRLKTLVEAQFCELEMPEATLDVGIEARDADDSAVDSTGLDQIEFLVRTNPGQENLPLRKIASGGEISRIMLALKTILADKDQISVLVFDEIDSNIGDRLGATIGRKMRALANGERPGQKAAGDKPSRRGKTRDDENDSSGGGGGHQIICITHLSQIAACADHHLQISKSVIGSDATKQTVAKVRVLEAQERISELAAMMAGKTPTAATLAHAKDLLARAAL